MGLGKTISQYRKLRDLTQAELASKIDVHQSQIAHWEKERFRPRTQYVEKLSEALEISVDDLLSGEPRSLEEMSRPGFLTVGKRIASLRKARDLTQRDLAERLGVAQSHVARWETGKAQPRQKGLEELADVLEVTMEELLVGAHGDIGAFLEIEDEELLSLLKELKNLGTEDIKALKIVIQGLLSRNQLQALDFSK